MRGARLSAVARPVGFRASAVAPFTYDAVADVYAGLWSDLVLETYAETSDALYRYRAVNNGRSAGWRRPPLTAPAPGVGTLGLHAVWMTDGLVSLKVGAFDEALFRWQTSESSSLCEAGALPFCPTLSPEADGRLFVSWLEEQPADNTYRVCSVWVSWPGDLVSASPVVTWEIPPPGPGFGIRYLASSSSTDGEPMVVTRFIESPTSGRTALEWEHPTGELAGTLAYFVDHPPLATAATRDPSVSTSPDGMVTVYAWEEQPTEAVGGKGGAPGAYIMLKVVDRRIRLVWTGEPVVYGPFPAHLGRESYLLGGEPSVCVTDNQVHLVWQGLEGGVHLARAPMRAVGDAWSASVPWHAVATGTFRLVDRGYLGPGWLPHVSARTLANGDDVVAVVWEHTEGKLQNNDSKRVELAFVQAPEFGGPKLYELSGTRSLASAEVDQSPVRFQLSPTVVIGPEDIGLDYVPVDVIWFDVDKTPGSEQARLLHRRYAFDGDPIVWVRTWS
jgi:hypothetical protein